MSLGLMESELDRPQSFSYPMLPFTESKKEKAEEREPEDPSSLWGLTSGTQGSPYSAQLPLGEIQFCAEEAPSSLGIHRILIPLVGQLSIAVINYR